MEQNVGDESKFPRNEWHAVYGHNLTRVIHYVPLVELLRVDFWKGDSIFKNSELRSRSLNHLIMYLTCQKRLMPQRG